MREDCGVVGKTRLRRKVDSDSSEDGCGLCALFVLLITDHCTIVFNKFN